MLIDVSSDALLNLFRVQSFFRIEESGTIVTNPPRTAHKPKIA